MNGGRMVNKWGKELESERSKGKERNKERAKEWEKEEEWLEDKDGR